MLKQRDFILVITSYDLLTIISAICIAYYWLIDFGQWLVVSYFVKEKITYYLEICVYSIGSIHLCSLQNTITETNLYIHIV